MFAQEPLSVRIRAWRPSVMQLALIDLAVVCMPPCWACASSIRIDFNRVFQDTPLEVVLVNARSTEAPTKAQAIAQANLAGGGEAEAGIATSPLPPSPSELIGDDQSTPPRRSSSMQEEQQQMLTQIRREIAAMPVPDPRKVSMTQSEREQEELRQQKLRLLAEIEKRINEENARPRRRYISPATREEVYAIYYDKLRHRSRIAARQLPDAQRPQAVRRADGQPHDRRARPHRRVRDRPQLQFALPRPARAGDRQRRGAVRQLQRRHEAAKADQIVVTSRFRFTKADGMQATMTNNGG
jgi:protein TonB